MIVKREIRLKIIICVRESPSIGDDRTDNLKGGKRRKRRIRLLAKGTGYIINKLREK